MGLKNSDDLFTNFGGADDCIAWHSRNRPQTNRSRFEWHDIDE